MNIFDFSQKMMRMDDEAWAKHSNPLSVYSRFTCLPLLSLSIWSREYLGWFALAFIALALFWIWYNPRAFNAPKSTDNWASKGTFGERIFLQKDTIAIPEHHVRMAHLLTWLSTLGLPVFLYGLWINDLGIIFFGNYLLVFPKVWFVDRMNWIYEDMKDTNPEFMCWLKAGPKGTP